jgi:hypothetical protein
MNHDVRDRRKPASRGSQPDSALPETRAGKFNCGVGCPVQGG